MIALASTTTRLALACAGASAAALVVSVLIVRAPLDDLAAARIELARHRAILAQPPAPASRPLPLGEMIGARTAAAASDRLGQMLQKRALDGGLLVEALDPRPGAELAEVSLTVSGSEAALLRFVAGVESERPLVRFRSWRFTAAADAKAVRLNAVAVAVWSDEA